MTAPRTPSTRTTHFSLIASLILLAGCGGEPSINDTAETIRPDAAKPATEPTKPATEPANPTPPKADPAN